ncbi:MAG: GNAT family N-acetyltransferase [Ruminococcaceae bacterium]|nr:GNAT family N-acetyltransferase [Oscillospiraceae bacterium]
MIEYKELKEAEITRELFSDFVRTQEVTRCWRKEEGEWVIKDIAFTENWGEKEYQTLTVNLKHTSATGGFVAAAFSDGKLKGFVSVESETFGSERQYIELSSIHVSRDMRGNGIGGALFGLAKERAKKVGAKKLYISAHSSVESQAFYRAMGCIEAREYSAPHVLKEPCDCQLEYNLE